ncbi:MAG TPA: asparagine synthase (glutamine-hydrolyzing), partial [Candidatus Polarisedimenticolia bacterium]|jgi:asparagine synthase (glutamine-hydrolysing)|nr:asparagine synthase (glutamine-hydrolyzing) [Candidatus Polarisedimenticolia bacterium]
MTDALVHRGPDDEGFHVQAGVALGMRRLSIIDLQTGHQPISNEDGSIWVVFNGEVYNYLELREDLMSRGHRFKTRSDTEVLVHLYEERGYEFVTAINAMAALALWDGGKRRLLLARDRLGKKPLHYALTPEALVFGSEIKALLRHPAVGAELDHASVARYLVHEYVPCPGTIYRGIRKLRPGHLGIFEAGRFTERPYWDMPAQPAPEPRTGAAPPAAQVEETIRQTLLEAVRCRLMSDVPLGVFLSGGIDSTSIVACMSRAAPGSVRTFSVAFKEPSFDESVHFQSVARHFGTRHEERLLTPAEMLDILPALASTMDEPLGDASILPTYLLSRFTREKVTVALGGDGGDELLAGYPTYQAHRLAAVYDRLPAALRSGLIEPLVRRLPVSRANISLDFKAKKFISGAGLPPAIRNQIWLGSFSGTQALSILRRELREELATTDLFDEARRHMDRAPAPDLLGKLLYVDLKMYLQDGVLVKVDRASMACSLEVRAPMLDYRFVELVGRLPTSWKLRGWTTKHIFKRAMKPWLPPGIVGRPKKGFGIPVAEWLRGPLRGMMLDLLAPERLKRQGILDPAAVAVLIRDHLEGRHDHRKPIWTLLMLQLWQDHWGRGAAA